jgi:hypothetical protein
MQLSLLLLLVLFAVDVFYCHAPGTERSSQANHAGTGKFFSFGTGEFFETSVFANFRGTSKNWARFVVLLLLFFPVPTTSLIALGCIDFLQ